MFSQPSFRYIVLVLLLAESGRTAFACLRRYTPKRLIVIPAILLSIGMWAYLMKLQPKTDIPYLSALIAAFALLEIARRTASSDTRTDQSGSR